MERIKLASRDSCEHVWATVWTKWPQRNGRNGDEQQPRAHRRVSDVNDLREKEYGEARKKGSAETSLHHDRRNASTYRG
jgi:hypothetical protein